MESPKHPQSDNTLEFINKNRVKIVNNNIITTTILPTQKHIIPNTSKTPTANSKEQIIPANILE